MIDLHSLQDDALVGDLETEAVLTCTLVFYLYSDVAVEERPFDVSATLTGPYFSIVPTDVGRVHGMVRVWGRALGRWI